LRFHLFQEKNVPKLRPEPPFVGVELELYNALLRLMDGNPRQPDLRKKLRKDQLRINPTTVAKEAGRSRTLIGHQKCDYPRIRALIKAEQKAPSEVPTSFEEINGKLREENRSLRAAVNLSMSRVAAMLLRMGALEKKANAKIKTAQRAIDSASPRVEHEEVVGKRLIEKQETVVPLKRD
jgi:hypothetical protein